MPTTTPSTCDQFVTLRGGPTVRADVITRLVQLEAAGVAFALAGGHVQARPASLIAPEDRAFLRAHRADVVAIVAYEPPELPL